MSALLDKQHHDEKILSEVNVLTEEALAKFIQRYAKKYELSLDKQALLRVCIQQANQVYVTLFEISAERNQYFQFIKAAPKIRSASKKLKSLLILLPNSSLRKDARKVLDDVLFDCDQAIHYPTWRRRNGRLPDVDFIGCVGVIVEFYERIFGKLPTVINHVEPDKKWAMKSDFHRFCESVFKLLGIPPTIPASTLDDMRKKCTAGKGKNRSKHDKQKAKAIPKSSSAKHR